MTPDWPAHFAAIVQERLALDRPTAADTEQSLIQLRARREAEERGLHPRALTQPRRSYARLWPFSIGGSAFVATAIGIVAHLATTPSTVPHHFQTARGQRAIVRLTNGTTLTLAPATTVTMFPQSVDVIGEIYCVIAKHTSQPVSVRTTNAVAEVLGTAFTVRRYLGEHQTQVVVDEGRVAVRRRGSEVRAALGRDEMAQLPDSGALITSSAPSTEYSAWRRDILVFNHAPLKDVVMALNYAYDARVRVSDSTLANTKIVAEVKVQEPLPLILDIITATMNAHYAQDGDTYVLSPGRSTRANPSAQSQVRHIFQLEKLYGK